MEKANTLGQMEAKQETRKGQKMPRTFEGEDEETLLFVFNYFLPSYYQNTIKILSNTSPEYYRNCVQNIS